MSLPEGKRNLRLRRGNEMFRIAICRAFLLLGGLGVLSYSAVAQDASVPDLTSMSIEDLSQIRLSTASRHLEDPRKAPAAVTVITSEEITRYGWRTLADLLRSVTGFYTAYDRTYSYVGVRGFLQSGDYNARILLLIDGHRVNENIYDSALMGTEFPLDLNLIDRVEVVRGPGSSLFGTNAPELAVVNVFTRQPSHQNMAEVTTGAGALLLRSHGGDARVVEEPAQLRSDALREHLPFQWRAATVLPGIRFAGYQ